MPLTSQMSFRVVGLGSLGVEEHVAYITNEPKSSWSGKPGSGRACRLHHK